MSNWSVPKDENGKAYFSYRKVTYWVNSTENYKYIIKGDLDYRPEIIEDMPVPVASEFTDWKTGIKYIMRNDGWHLLPGSGGGGGGDITRDEVIAMDAEVLNAAKAYADSKVVFVRVAENQIINGQVVPKLTKNDLQTLFNANQNGKCAYIKDAESENIYVVKQSALEGVEQSVLFDYKGIMILEYVVAEGEEDVTTNYYTIGGGGSSAVIIEVEENQTINGYQVPKLTAEDLMRAYNGLIAGNPTVIVDASGNYNFALKQADTDTEDFFVCFDFCGIMILTYKLHDEDVTTTFTAISGQPTHFLKSIIKEETDISTNITIDNESDVATTFSIPKGGESASGWKYIDQLNKIEDYFYQVKLKTHDYEFANNYFKSAEAEVPTGSCTTIAKDGLFGRNYDWTFDNTVEFLYNVDYVANVRRASISMVGGARQFSKAYIESGLFTDNVKLIPFYATDGVNDAGVKVSTHVLNNGGYGTDDGIINPSGDVEKELASLMLPRYILDNFTSATNAVNYIMQNVKIYHPQPLIDMGYIQTFTIADGEHTYILEPWNGEFKLVTDKTAIVTNFEWWHTTTEDGILWTNADIPEGKHPGTQTNSQHWAMGVERYNLAFRSIEDLTLDVNSLKTTMKKLKYSRMYDSHPNPPEKAWLSEYVSPESGLSADASRPEMFETVRSEGAAAYTNRDRNTAQTWQTVHSAIYDWANKMLWVSVQEQDAWYGFNIPWYPGELATVDYVDAADELLRNHIDTELLKKSPVLEAGTNITLELTEEGRIKVSSAGGGGDVTKEYVDAQDSEVLNTAKTYAEGKAHDAELSAKSYTDSEYIKLQNRIKVLEDWMDSIGDEDLEYIAPDDTTVTMNHLVYKPSE